MVLRDEAAGGSNSAASHIATVAYWVVPDCCGGDWRIVSLVERKLLPLALAQIVVSATRKATQVPQTLLC